MNNLYNNVIDKNNFYNKLTAVSALLVSLIYILSVTLIPIISGIISTKNNTYVSAAKQYNALSNKVLVTKTNNVVFNTINTATYINNGQMLTRQIDNANLQSYISDVKGSVLKLNSADKTNNQTYSCDAYGKPVANITKPNPALNVLNPFQYNGERYDNNTNLQYLRSRFYNPETKRFINQDSYELLNRFGYADGNPIMGIDPSGHVFNFLRGGARRINSAPAEIEMTTFRSYDFDRDVATPMGALAAMTAAAVANEARPKNLDFNAGFEETKTYESSRFRNYTFTGAHYHGGEIMFSNCKFADCDFSEVSYMFVTSFYNCTFENCKFNLVRGVPNLYSNMGSLISNQEFKQRNCVFSGSLQIRREFLEEIIKFKINMIHASFAQFLKYKRIPFDVIIKYVSPYLLLTNEEQFQRYASRFFNTSASNKQIEKMLKTMVDLTGRTPKLSLVERARYASLGALREIVTYP